MSYTTDEEVNSRVWPLLDRLLQECDYSWEAAQTVSESIAKWLEQASPCACAGTRMCPHE